VLTYQDALLLRKDFRQIESTKCGSWVSSSSEPSIAYPAETRARRKPWLKYRRAAAFVMRSAAAHVFP
jgi:hypothetical protein